MIRLLRMAGGDSLAARLLLRTGLVDPVDFLHDGAAAPVLQLFFDARWYARRYPDVRNSGLEPLVHYLAYGAAEGRNPHPLFRLKQSLLHYAEHSGETKLPLRLVTFFVRYGTGKYPYAHERFRELLDGMFPGAWRWDIVIDNKLPPGSCTSSGDHEVLIGGDNTHWEFSGWDQGIEYAGSALEAADWVVFATDAFEQLYVDYLTCFSIPVLESLSGRRAATGHIDCFDKRVELYGREAQHWIRTSFFLLQPSEVITMGSFVSVSNPAEIFSGDPQCPFQPDAPIDQQLQTYIISWLTGDGTGQGVTWHSRFDLTTETLPYFEKKCLAILNELMLSARLRESGCPLVDISWAELVKNETSANPAALFDTPWSEQLRRRPSAGIFIDTFSVKPQR